MNFFVILLLLLAGGIYGMLHWIPLEEIGHAFHRMITLLFLVGTAVILLSFQPEGTTEITQFLLLLGAAASGLLHRYALWTEQEGLRLLTYWTGVGLVLLVVASIGLQSPMPDLMDEATTPTVNVLHLLASAAIMGAIVDAMICGHWYLVNADLSLEPIRSISRVLTLSILLKILLVGWSLYRTKAYDPYLFERVVFLMPILFWVRVLAGLAGGLFFNWMSWKALEHGNTQAATGILYACITWIILGEFSAFYLTIQTGVPL